MSPKKSALPRGFKAEAERIAVRLRKELRLSVWDPLPATKLAVHLDVLLIRLSDLPLEPERLAFMHGLSGTPIEWHAATIIGEDEKPRIVHNCGCSVARQESNLMHELSHILREHKHEREETYFGFPTRFYNPVHEAEAACLGATLQLPKPVLLWTLREKWEDQVIAERYGASLKMVQFRKYDSGAVRIRSRIDTRA